MRLASRLARDRSGASALITILILPVMLGFSVLAIDGGMAYVQKRRAQDAADAAAYSAAIAYISNVTDITKEARAVTEEYGLEHGTNGVSVNVNRPATSGPYAGNGSAVEVVITRPMLTFFASLFGSSGGTLRARAVSLAGRKGDVCVHILNPTASSAMLVNGNPSLTAVACAVQVNSNASWAMLLNGSPHITASDARVVGGYFTNGTPVLDIDRGSIRTGQPSIPDAYASVPVPTGACNYSGATSFGNGTHTILSAGPTTPTVICSNGAPAGLNFVMTSGKVTFQPGIYVFKGTSLAITGSGFSVEGTGVTFVFTKGSGTTTGGVTINGTPAVQLSAPPAGPTAGMLFFGDPTATSASQSSMNGSNNSFLTGAMYFPRSNVVINGSNSITGTCLQLIADTVTFNGSSTFGLNCGGVGTKPIGMIQTGLVE